MVDWVERFRALAEELASRRAVLVVQGAERRGRSDLFYGRPGAEMLASYLAAAECTYQATRVCDLDDLLLDAAKRRDDEDLVYVGGYAQCQDLEALPGAIAALTARPVFPQSGADTIASEDKLVAKAIARNAGLLVQPDVQLDEAALNLAPIVVKQIVGGDSIGLSLYRRGCDAIWCPTTAFAEPYFEGFDLDVYTLRSPDTGRHVVIGATGIHPHTEQPFIQDYAFKAAATARIGADRSGAQTFQKASHTLSAPLTAAISRMLEYYRTSTFSRLDLRVAASAAEAEQIDLADTRFLEVNTLPNLGGPRREWWTYLEPFFASLQVDPLTLEPVARAADSATRAIVALLLIWRLNRRYSQS